jgi:adenine-specific DNA-methyltransferase
MSSTKTKLKLGDNYLSGQIITYMGNKRKLLPIISDIIDKIKTEIGSANLTIGDGFAGSGIVSRLFKTKAHTLYTNDLAGYSKTLNECYLSTPDEARLQQIKMYIDAANNQETNASGGQGGCTPPFISGNWSPASPTITEQDRVYFTYENGKRIDAIRNYIDTIPTEYRSFLLAPLLVQCSIHNNTNGQFSAFYKDATASKGAYGGKNGIDIKRIAQPIILPYPLLDLDDPCEVIISQLDTNVWAKNLKNSAVEMDIVYYDPPYNKHPYNIYYFMLDIINTWDKTATIPATNRGQSDSRTKSLYNSTSKAKDAMNDLLLNTNAKYIILSYNDGGIIPIADLDALLAKHGKSVEKIPIDHKTYNRLKGISNYKRTKEYKAVKEFMYVIKK